jgi:tetratricopeptide (TPR) repeat protein
MQGCYSEAIREWEAFSRESGRRNPVVECFVKVKLANLYSHAGLQDRSLELLERLASPENRRKFGAHWWWACYHKAVTLRRSRRYHEARDLLQIVFAKWSQAAESTLGISALHQLGVVDLHERSCEAAVDKFEECVHGWGSDLYDGNYRKGFEYRRLGEAKLLAGRDRAAAREDLAKARQVFAWCHCKRYVEETIKDMEEMGM